MDRNNEDTDRDRTTMSSASLRKLLPRTLPSTFSKNSSPSRNGKRKATSLPTETVEYLKNWILSPEHIAHPYPTEQEKVEIMKDTGIELKQLTNWFVNNRKRFWKPRVEARIREQRNQSTSSSPTSSPSRIVKAVSMGSLGELARRNSVGSDSPVMTGHLISAQSSVVSETNSVVDESNSDGYNSAGQTTEEVVSRTETVDVHILRPLQGSGEPSIEDITILSNIPAERILHSYNDCLLTFTCNAADAQNPKKFQRKRDAEVVRLKKHYLKLFNSSSTSANEAIVDLEPPVKRRRMAAPIKIQDKRDLPSYPRPEYRRASIELWKEACQKAGCVYDKELPSLEEATNLFGYASTEV